jgi:GH15 family glucan-1,4-alpha-glucosidase
VHRDTVRSSDSAALPLPIEVSPPRAIGAARAKIFEEQTTMALPIEDYALIGDMRTAALVGSDGSIDWLCLPRFDSGACFAALLGNTDHGRWLLAPDAAVRAVRRAYRDGTLILETEFELEGGGAARVVDWMPHLHGHGQSSVIRVVEGLRGQVPMRMELVIRYDYGSVIPWVRRQREGAFTALAGPDALLFQAPVPFQSREFRTVSEFEISRGERLPFVITWFPSHQPVPATPDPDEALAATEHWWREWSGRGRYDGEWREEVSRSLITLKALTYAPTGGIVAAPTTSLPEHPGGVRNWDYRYCWLRDATFTLYALLTAGYKDEAQRWREWLLRAAAGRPEDLKILYGLAGERRLSEFELDWLPGYEGSRPVRIGNAANTQFQLDVYGEVMDMLHVARTHGLQPSTHAWELQRMLLDFLESNWRNPDDGIWEVRGGRQHFTYSKMMAWVALDRAVKDVERFRLEGPLERWRRIRAEIHEQICREGFNAGRGAFTQHYGSQALDASLLLMPMVGFLPASDARVRATVFSIERELAVDGLVARYSGTGEVDGLPEGEGAFLPCSFWLVDNLVMQGRREEARALFQRLLGLRNDVGLLSEEYDVERQHQLGNFPQAFTHVMLVNSARNLSRRGGPAEHRGAASKQPMEPANNGR